MSQSTRRKIAQLRALAASTTFPEEAKSAKTKADQLEASLGGPDRGKYGGFAGPQSVPPPFSGNNFRAVDLGGVLTPEIFAQMREAMERAIRSHNARYTTAINPDDILRDIFQTTPPRKEGKTDG